MLNRNETCCWYNILLELHNTKLKYRLINIAIVTLALVITAPIWIEFLYLKGYIEISTSCLSTLKQLFGSKEVFWVAYTGIATFLSLILTFWGTFLYPTQKEKLRDIEEQENLINSLSVEIYQNWQCLSSENFEIAFNRNRFDDIQSHIFELTHVISTRTIGKLNSLYQKFFVFEFLLTQYYNICINHTSTGNERLISELAFRTHEQRYQCLVEVIDFIVSLESNQKHTYLQPGQSIPMGVLSEKIRKLAETYKENISIEKIKNRLTVR